MDPKKADEFGHRLDNLAQKPDHGKYLTKLVKSGDLTPDGFRRIEAALATV